MSATKILWGQILTVFLIVLMTTWAATQWTAYRLGFQQQLGVPWFDLAGCPIYYPPAFFWWWYFYDAYAPPIFIEGACIAASGGFISIAVAIGMSVWRAREAKNAETFGSARWADAREVSAAGLLGADGVVLGKFERDYLRHDGPEHVLCFAPTRSGKGVGLVVPSLLTWPGSAIVHDIKGENWTLTAGYVGANVAQVTPLVGGPVREVLVDDTVAVKRGHVLVRLDDTDAKLALARAEAELAATERRVRGLIANDSGLGAQIAARSADQSRAAAQFAAARGDLDRARLDLQRREALVASGSVSEEELTAARNAHSTALANYQAADAARAQAAANRTSAIGSRDANRALIETRAGADNPEVLAARAARDQARVDLERTVLRAPVDGIVSRRQVQVGQRVQAGAMLMIIVPIQAAYVDANFKEGQLKKVRPGQRVTLTSDLYGESVEYHGTVVGFSGGTGAAFAVVPAQNATGNWIKVVQRLPVRIRLDPRQLAEHPLRVGLSMTVDIDVSN